jgi:hypothetical protein
LDAEFDEDSFCRFSATPIQAGKFVGFLEILVMHTMDSEALWRSNVQDTGYHEDTLRI